MSQAPLQKPIVGDTNGFLYNKEAVIEFLLDRSKYEGGFEHIKSLKVWVNLWLLMYKF